MARSKKTARKGKKSPKPRAKKALKKSGKKKSAARKARPPAKKTGQKSRPAAKKAVKKTARKAAPKKARKKTRKKAGEQTVRKKVLKKRMAPKKSAKPAVKKKKPVKKTKAAPKKTVKKGVRTRAKKRIVKKAVKKVVKKPSKKKAVKKEAKKILKKAEAKSPTGAAVPAGAKKEAPSILAVPYEERRAYGSYNGVVVCEKPKVFPRTTPYSKKEIEALETLLQRERGRLREVMRDLDQLTFNIGEETAGAMPGYSIHLAEDATNNADTETALLLRQDEEAGLMQVEAALERLSAGVFGVCIACGSKIGIQRLRAVPETHLCMTCKRVYDKRLSGL